MSLPLGQYSLDYGLAAGLVPEVAALWTPPQGMAIIDPWEYSQAGLLVTARPG